MSIFLKKKQTISDEPPKLERLQISGSVNVKSKKTPQQQRVKNRSTQIQGMSVEELEEFLETARNRDPGVESLLIKKIALEIAKVLQEVEPEEWGPRSSSSQVGLESPTSPLQNF